MSLEKFEGNILHTLLERLDSFMKKAGENEKLKLIESIIIHLMNFLFFHGMNSKTHEYKEKIIELASGDNTNSYRKYFTIRGIIEGMYSCGYDKEDIAELGLILLECLRDFSHMETEFTLNARQINEIKRGLAQGLDTSIYGKPEFSYYQMVQIRLGLKNNVDVSIYAKKEFTHSQMKEIREGLEKGVDVSIYANHEFNWEQMREIRYGLEIGIDVSAYAKPEFHCDQMKDIKETIIKEK